MKNASKIYFVLVCLLLAVASAQVFSPRQITRFMILDGWGDTLLGITHDQETSPIFYDVTAGAIPPGRIMQSLAPDNFLTNQINSYGFLTFDYDTENKIVYFGSAGDWKIYRISIDGSGLEPVFSSEYIFVKHLQVDAASNTIYFSAYALPYVNRTAIVTEDFYFSTSTLDANKLAYVVVKANLVTGEVEELFYSVTQQALVFNSNYNLMFLVDVTSITVMTMDKTVVDVIPTPLGVSAVESSVLYDRNKDVIYLATYSTIFYLRYSTQESGVISVSSSIYAGLVWHDSVYNAFYFMPSGSEAPVYHIGYDSFEGLISRNSYVATKMFTIRQPPYGIFALACDSTSVSDCGWNSSSLPTYVVAAIVLLIVLPCAGCIGFIAAACNRKEMKFPVDQWASMPLNNEPDANAPEE